MKKIGFKRFHKGAWYVVEIPNPRTGNSHTVHIQYYHKDNRDADGSCRRWFWILEKEYRPKKDGHVRGAIFERENDNRVITKVEPKLWPMLSSLLRDSLSEEDRENMCKDMVYANVRRLHPSLFNDGGK